LGRQIGEILSMEHPISDDYLKCIGDMTVSFSLLEFWVKSISYYLIRDNQRIAQIITSELSFKSLRTLVMNLYSERYGENSYFLLLRLLMDRAAALEDRRNQITHSMWAVGRKPNSILRIKTTSKEKRGLQFQFEDLTIEQLSKIVDDIKKLSGEFSLFWTKLIDRGK
jgi:hypothetical protein